jgi:hypothetical protein
LAVPSSQNRWVEEIVATVINSAEEVSGPLEGLVEETSNEPGAPFVRGARATAGVAPQERRKLDHNLTPVDIEITSDHA